jgi:hypothetical protein
MEFGYSNKLPDWQAANLVNQTQCSYCNNDLSYHSRTTNQLSPANRIASLPTYQGKSSLVLVRLTGSLFALDSSSLPSIR